MRLIVHTLPERVFTAPGTVRVDGEPVLPRLLDVGQLTESAVFLGNAETGNRTARIENRDGRMTGVLEGLLGMDATVMSGHDEAFSGVVTRIEIAAESSVEITR